MPTSACTPGSRGSPRPAGACTGARTGGRARRSARARRAARVHHRDPIGERRDHGQVVADVHGRDAVGAAQVADRLEHVRLRRHVEPGRRLVQHDHPGPVGERHRERRRAAADRPTAGAGTAAGRRRRSGAAPRRASRRCARVAAVVRPEAVLGERLLELRADPHRRVERGGGSWGTYETSWPRSCWRSSGRASGCPGPRSDLAARDAGPAARVPEHGEPDRRLARPRLADEPEHLAGRDPERDLVDDVLVVSVVQLDAEIDDLERVRASALIRRPPPRSIPIAARASPSPIRLVPIVSSPIAITGSSTGHGWSISPFWFSLIISPQSAAGGWSPKPRKLSPATTAMLNVRRSVVSTMSGLDDVREHLAQDDCGAGGRSPRRRARSLARRPRRLRRARPGPPVASSSSRPRL